MRHDETRDNLTDIENQSIEADAHEYTREWSSEPDPAGVQLEAEADPRPFRQPEERHEEHNDGANGYDEDEPEDDGQPSEYEEWQDFMGGDDHYDHSENGEW